MKIVAVTACPTGIAHTYMAAEQLAKSAKKFGHNIKVETQGSMGIENELSQAEVDAADLCHLRRRDPGAQQGTVRQDQDPRSGRAGSDQETGRHFRETRTVASRIMPRELQFLFPLKNGLHARPASAFQDLANLYASTITLVNEESGATANGKSTLALVGTMTKEGDRCVVRIDGADGDRAADAFRKFLDGYPPALRRRTSAAGDARPAGRASRVSCGRRVSPFCRVPRSVQASRVLRRSLRMRAC